MEIAFAVSNPGGRLPERFRRSWSFLLHAQCRGYHAMCHHLCIRNAGACMSFLASRQNHTSCLCQRMLISRKSSIAHVRFQQEHLTLFQILIYKVRVHRWLKVDPTNRGSRLRGDRPVRPPSVPRHVSMVGRRNVTFFPFDLNPFPSTLSEPFQIKTYLNPF